MEMAASNKCTTVVLVLCLVPFIFADDEDYSKRLLLNDQDAVGARLANMETTIQLLTQSLTETKTKMGSLETELKAKTSLLEQLKLGSTYIRWGRKQCTTDNTETVYSGFTAGQEYSRSSYYGGPSNTMCLPSNPEVSNRTSPGNSFIYGSEYENGNFFGPGAQNEDIPCALCRNTNTTTTVMIPGRETCYSGWKKEYNGVLASGCYNCKASSYICMDANPEYLQAGDRDDNGHLFYATQTICGSLPCPPYISGRAVNCVVCSI